MLPTLRKRFPRGADGLSWQAQKGNSACKAALIHPELERLRCHSVLDVGCNAGQVARELSPNRFVVGIDQSLDFRGFSHPLKGVALGEFPLGLDNVHRLPNFDAVLLLSVHHQWYAKRDESEADENFRRVLSIAGRALFIEFAALSAKFGSVERFVDNDAASVQSFAKNFLAQFSGSENVKFLGCCPESKREPQRFMFMIEK